MADEKESVRTAPKKVRCMKCGHQVTTTSFKCTNCSAPGPPSRCLKCGTTSLKNTTARSVIKSWSKFGAMGLGFAGGGTLAVSIANSLMLPVTAAGLLGGVGIIVVGAFGPVLLVHKLWKLHKSDFGVWLCPNKKCQQVYPQSPEDINRAENIPFLLILKLVKPLD